MSCMESRNVLMGVFRHAAENKLRCPDNDALSDAVYSAGGKRWREALDELVKDGQISIEIAGKNWRVVHLVGDNLRTAPEPQGRHPWLVIDRFGKHKA